MDASGKAGMNRSIALAAVLVSTSLAAQAERSIFDRAKLIYAVMDLRVSTLKQCAKLDSANKTRYDAEIQRYRQENKALSDKIKQIIVAEVPSTPAETSLGVIEKWSASESQRNMQYQQAQHEQFLQKCDYMINPAGRKRYGATAAWTATLTGPPQAEYPDDVKAINAWKP
jgi:hypothetical protein